MKEEVTAFLIDIFDRINIQTPSNFDEILEFVYNGICGVETTEFLAETDVSFYFKLWIEKQTKINLVDTN